ncbi:MAG: TRAP transporter permease [Deltaproteobacteria bacterium]|jgi:TRAP transporter 4TM/12TM fusion protein|nr:TRAP transporter permease [Deltaproteobacteria bacterium]
MHAGNVTQSSDVIQQMLEKETGQRKPHGLSHFIIIFVAISWSLIQLWITSPLPYSFGFGVLNDTASRSLHLAFAIFLAYLGFPILKRGPLKHIPIYDWLMALTAAFCACYLFIFQDQLVKRPGMPATQDIVVAVVGVLLLLEATRRVMGLPMTVVAVVFLSYAFLGPYAPDVIAHRGATLSRAASQFWITQEGVFGVPLGVSTSFVFLYVLFGAMLENAGAGNYLTALSFALLGQLKGGPAKAAVVASGLNGLISGSSIANVLTTGPVTILLMKKVGFSAEKAGAVEVSASSNGQIMPPVMGAAALLMAEYINMPYAQLIKHAFIPAILAYLSLLYIVHIEASKMGMEPIYKPRSPLFGRLVRFGLITSSSLVLLGGLYYLMAWIPTVFGDYSWLIFALLLITGYVLLLLISLRFPELPEGDLESLMHVDSATPVIFSGLYFLMPTGTLVWGLMVMEMSPGLAAYYGCLMMIFILLTQRPLVAWLKKRPVLAPFKLGLSRLLSSLVNGAKNMVGIGLATATAGIMVGTVSLTGVGQVLASLVEILSGGFLPAVLIMTAMLAIVLGMGLPTTANYIIVSTLLAPVIYTISAAHGLGIPILAIHLFCLYFGVMADATPPVALAAFAASGISGGDPFKTGVQGFIYELRTAVLPFVFIYNQEILLLNIQSPLHFIWVLTTSILACLAFASATQRFIFIKTTWYEVLGLILAMIFLFRPDIPQNMAFKPFQEFPPTAVNQLIEELEPGSDIRLHLVTNFRSGRQVDQVVVLPFTETTAEDRLMSAGVYLAWDKFGRLMIDDILFNSRIEKLGINMDDPTQVLGIEVPNTNRPPKWIFSIPGLLILVIVLMSQFYRQKQEAKHGPRPGRSRSDKVKSHQSRSRSRPDRTKPDQAKSHQHKPNA